MDDNDYPNFGAAYPTTAFPTEHASWNPALRPQAHAEQPAVSDTDDDFFERYPGATPKKQSGALQQGLAQDADDSEEGHPSPAHQGERVHADRRVMDVRRDTVAPEELAQAPGSIGEGDRKDKEDEGEDFADDARDEDEDAAVFRPNETIREQEQDLEHYLPHVPASAPAEAEDLPRADHAIRSTSPNGQMASPEQHYEHQSEITAMEEAQDESVAAPLMDDEEAPPTPGPELQPPFFDQEDSDTSPPSIQGRPATISNAPPPHLARSFTTNFTVAAPVNEPEERHVGAGQQLPTTSEDWPGGSDDDKTFGVLLGDDDDGEVGGPERKAGSRQETLEELPAPEEDLAAAWQAALDDDDLLDESESAEKDLDTSKFFGNDDDDGFLEDEDDVTTTEPAQSAQGTVDQYRPAQTQQQRQQRLSQIPQNPYQPGPQFATQPHGRASGTPDTGLFDLHNQGLPSMQQRPALQREAQSFADKSKGGYQSPYDLPMDVISKKPRKQTPSQTKTQTQGQMPAVTQQYPVPPPRSSSFSSQTQTQRQPPASLAPPSPPSSSGHPNNRPAPAPPQQMQSPPSPSSSASSARTTPKTDTGFFAELPIAPRLRKAASMATTASAYLSQQPSAPIPTSALPQAHPSRIVQPTQRGAQSGMPAQGQQQNPYASLRRPERMPLLPDHPTTAPSQAGPSATQPSRYSPVQAHATAPRYSPAPPSTAAAPPSSRYSPAPTSLPPQPQPRPRNPSSNASAPNFPPQLQQQQQSSVHAARPFAPRTSSPLAYQLEKPHPPLPKEVTPSAMTISPPRPNGVLSAAGVGAISPERKAPGRYVPTEPGLETQSSGVGGPPMQASLSQGDMPQRPRTQSPSETMKPPRLAMAIAQDRPMSAAGAVPVMRGQQQQQQQQQPLARPKGVLLPHRRQFSRELIFAAPQDERAQDALERWRGHPIFSWNAAGSVVSSFPKQTPFYTAGQGAPSVKCTPGDIVVQDATAFLPLEERVVKFPGPLTARSRGRKKEIVSWLGSKVEDLQRETEAVGMDYGASVDVKKRTEEKFMLWQVMQIYVEHDGALEGSPEIDNEVRRVLLPNLEQMAQVADIRSPVSANMPAGDILDKQVIFQLRQALLEGQRERAVWLAEEHKLWGHAMLIAATLGGATWTQLTGAFVRSQVQSAGTDARSLAALYQVFAGNAEDVVDELVPPSARAGYRMINTSDGRAAGNPLEGLDQWRETLALVASNRTPGDGTSLVALGRLLASYGRAAAAHTCYLFARGFAKHSGADDAEADFTLLGANHQSADESWASDLDAILLTEVYEWATSLALPSTAVPYMPHLQAFKLSHAQQLAAYGLKTKAQSYCEHITVAYTSTTRPSQYYHPVFTQAVNDLGAFLAQAPQDGKAGFFGSSKPALNKVSSGVGTWFTKFISGEEDREASALAAGQGATQADMMPAPAFGGVGGEVGEASGTEPYGPMIGGSQLPAEPQNLYAPMMGGIAINSLPTPATTLQPFAPSSAPGRYTPGNYSPQKSFPNPGGHGSGYIPDGLNLAERPASARTTPSRYAPSPLQQTAPASLGVPLRPDGAFRSASDYGMPYATMSRRGSAQDPGSQGSYEPRPELLAQEQSAYSPYQPIMPQTQGEEAEDAFARPNGVASYAEFEPSIPDAESGGYEPPTGGYEPPSYQPYQPDPETDDDAEGAAPKPKKKSFMDDDDEDASDIAQRAARLQQSQADRAADEAFRKAAEADASRDNAKGGLSGDKKPAGWFGGWLKGKDPNNSAPGPIRAKLGEEKSSFYYDEQLKKWVNKKGGTETPTQAAATPPPPRGPASRLASAAASPPTSSGPPSRAASATGLAPGSRPPTSAGMSSGPPSRVTTPASNPSSSAAAAEYAGPGMVAGLGLANGGESGVPSGPPSRPPTSMSTASSLDDLLAGPPGGKKGGTVKGKKKGGRYVDVMAL